MKAGQPKTVDEAVAMNPDLAMPSDLSPEGQKAWRIVMERLVHHGLTFTGGCRTFYSPKEWRERRETYGIESELIVVYDGGEVGFLFEYDRDMACGYRHIEDLIAALGAMGSETTRQT